MPTDFNFGPGELFFEDSEGKKQKLAELQQFENNVVDERDDAVDALRYGIQAKGSWTGDFSITLTKQQSRQFQKALGIETITRKRFIKLLMGYGIQRNKAQEIAKMIHINNGRYARYFVKEIVGMLRWNNGKKY